jgi:arylsulfatase A-like enzyme
MNFSTLSKLVIICIAIILSSCKTDPKSNRSADNEAALPNILFLYMDDMGIGDPECYNPESLIPTPNINKLATQGVKFTDAHTPAPVCGPSRYGLMTGRYPWRRGEYGFGNGETYQDVMIEEGRQTIASILKSKGYNTAQLGKWGLKNNYSDAVKEGMEPGTIDAYDFPNKKLLGSNLFGFDYAYTQTHVYEKEGHDSLVGMAPITDCKMAFVNGLPVSPELEVENPYDLLPRSAEKLIEYIEVYGGKKENPEFGLDRSKPFFIYWDPVGPHAPYTPLPEFVGKSKVGKYGDYVVEIDHYIGKMLDALDELGLTKNTIVVFSSDNGPDKYSYSRIEEFKHYGMDSWRGLKTDLWEGGNRTPFIVKWPGQIEPNTVNEHQICLTDMMATFSELVGHELAEDEGEDSFSILTLLKTGEQTDKRPPILYNTPRGKLGIRKDEWVFIDAPAGGRNEPDWFLEERGIEIHDQKVELFNLEKDPGQTKNLALEYPQKVAELKLELDKMVAQGNSKE